MPEIKCPKCNSANKDTARFCVKCSIPLFVKCPGCEKENEINVSFCAHCGKNISEWRDQQVKEKEFHQVFEEGRNFFEQNEFDRALELWAKVPSGIFSVREKMAEAKKRQGEYSSAIKAGHKAFSQKSYCQAREQYQIADRLVSAAEKNKIKGLLSDATVQVKKQDFEQNLTLARNLRHDGKFKQAIELLEKLLTVTPGHREIKELLETVRKEGSVKEIARLITSGEESFAQGYYRIALTNWEKAARNIDDPARSLDLAQKIGDAQKRLKARKLIYRTVVIAGGVIGLILVIFFIFTERESAEKLYQEALFSREVGDLGEAQVTYEKLIETYPGHILAAEARFNVQQIIKIKGDLDKSIQVIDRYWQKKEFTKAKELCQKIVTDYPLTIQAEMAREKLGILRQSEKIPSGLVASTLPSSSSKSTANPKRPGLERSMVQQQLNGIQQEANRLLAGQKFDSAQRLYRDFIKKYSRQYDNVTVLAGIEADRIWKDVWADFTEQRGRIDHLLAEAFWTKNAHAQTLEIWRGTAEWEAEFLDQERKDLLLKILGEARIYFDRQLIKWQGRNPAKTIRFLRAWMHYTWDPDEIQSVNRQIEGIKYERSEESTPEALGAILGGQVQEDIKCQDCDGGRIKCSGCQGRTELRVNCPICDWLGFTFCLRCKGDGFYAVNEEKLKLAAEKFLAGD